MDDLSAGWKILVAATLARISQGPFAAAAHPIMSIGCAPSGFPIPCRLRLRGGKAYFDIHVRPRRLTATSFEKCGQVLQESLLLALPGFSGF